MTKEATTEVVATNNRRKIILGLIFAVMLGAGFIIWLYTGTLSNAKESIFKTLPLPVAVVDSRVVSSKQLFERVGLARDIFTSNGQVPDTLTSDILDQLIEVRKMEALARKHDVTATNTDLENAYSYVLQQIPNQDEAVLKDELEKVYGISIERFRTEILSQSVTRENLSLWFNSRESLNTATYTEARSILKQLDEGANFDELARKFSGDLSSEPFAGDSGFVNYSDLLPEFQKVVTDLAISDNQVVPSRYGIHILRINAIEDVTGSDGQTEKSYNIQQILIPSSNFNDWLQSEYKQIKSFRLI